MVTAYNRGWRKIHPGRIFDIVIEDVAEMQEAFFKAFPPAPMTEREAIETGETLAADAA